MLRLATSLVLPMSTSLARRTGQTVPYQARRFNAISSADLAMQKLKAAREAKDKLQKDWTAPVLTYEQVKPKTEQPSPDAYLIDVREQEEVLQGVIPSSVNIPLSVLSADLHLRGDFFRLKYGFEKPRKDQELIFYCRSGKRSASAADVAKRNGYANVYNYEGSWLDWTKREGTKGAA